MAVTKPHGSPVSGISTLTGAPRAAQEARLVNDSLRPQGVWYALRRRHQQRRGAFPCTLVVGRHVTERLQIAFAERYARGAAECHPLLEARIARSEEHTSELKSLRHLVWRLLL